MLSAYRFFPFLPDCDVACSCSLEDTARDTANHSGTELGVTSSAQSDQEAEELLPGDEPASAPVAQPAVQTVDALLAVCREVAAIRVQQQAMQEAIVMLRANMQEQQAAQAAAQEATVAERLRGKCFVSAFLFACM